jgi:hypothetical protein
MSNKKNISTNGDVLNIVYVVNNDIKFTISDEGIVTILKPNQRKLHRFFRKVKVNVPEESKIELDDKSSYVFSLINGERTVKDISELVDEKFHEKAHPLIENLLLFLNHLEVNEKWISQK